MNILIVCSGNSNQAVSFDMAKHRPFIYEQMRALNKNGIVTDTFFIRGNGITGYLSNLPALRERVKNGNYALVHAHNGLSALLANLQRIVPVVSTFHGSDLCSFKKRYFSYIAILLSRYVIYVSPLIEKIGRVVRKKDYTIIPCGIDTEIFYPIDKAEAREQMGLEQEQKYALFASRYDNPVKNYPLVREAFKEDVLKAHPGLRLIEMKNYTRREVNQLLNACDVLLVSSFRETGPQVIREAMACNCPVVTTEVGYARELLTGIDGNYITANNPTQYAEAIAKALNRDKRTKARERILNHTNEKAANQIKILYKKIIKPN